jgi:hypothetical protein
MSWAMTRPGSSPQAASARVLGACTSSMHGAYLVLTPGTFSLAFACAQCSVPGDVGEEGATEDKCARAWEDARPRLKLPVPGAGTA